MVYTITQLLPEGLWVLKLHSYQTSNRKFQFPQISSQTYR